MPRRYIRQLLISCLAASFLSGCGLGYVRFDSIQGESKQGIGGWFVTPAGPGPFPAVVLMHGCAGVKGLQSEWADRMRSWGYATLVVSSLVPRGVDSVCGREGTGRGGYADRVGDAYGALAYLKSLDVVDPDRIAIVGWSHGGGVVLRAVSLPPTLLNAMGSPLGATDLKFRAGVAFYPYCFPSPDFYANTLILIGQEDDWTPAVLCNYKEDRVDVKVYDGAYHRFDDAKPTQIYMGHVLGYDASAKADAIKRVRQFLDQNLGGSKGM